MTPILGYWEIRGFAQPIKLLLAYTETEYENKLYHYGPPPECDKSNWRNVKDTLGIAFPNLPYYIDGDLKLSQSVAIMRYLSRKNNLEPDTEEGRIRADVVELQAVDVRLKFAHLCYNPDFKNVKEGFLKTLPTELKEFSDFLGDKKWFAGDKLTYVDFIVYEALDHLRIFAPDYFKDYQNLKDFFNRFESLPNIQKYMKSQDFLKWPLYGDNATYGSRHTKP